MDKRVGLFIVGEPKSGTTALAHFLAQHPDVCMSVPKEPGYFATDFIRESDEFHGSQLYFHVRSFEEYSGLFSHATSERVFGEASTNYLYSKKAAKNIHEYNPEAKIIIMLREPVSFIHSLHMQYVNEVAEDETDFATALSKEDERKAGKGVPKSVSCPSYLYYAERAKYSEQVGRYLKIFPRSQVFIATMEEFKQDNAKVYKKVLEFLNIDLDYKPNFQDVHESKRPRFDWLNSKLHNPIFKRAMHSLLGERFYTWIQKRAVEKVLLKKGARQPLDHDLRATLSRQFLGEVKKTSKLIDRDLIEEWGYKNIE